jgi:hypothetical protein
MVHELSKKGGFQRLLQGSFLHMGKGGGLYIIVSGDHMVCQVAFR